MSLAFRRRLLVCRNMRGWRY